MSGRSQDIIERYRQRGARFAVGDLESFVLDEGSGDPVVLMHGVPASAFLFRKVVTQLAEHGMRGVAFDLPGLGFADRPADFDYSWTGLGRFAVAAVDALGLERFHLVVHDIGGPVGFELAAAMPERIRSLTVLNTLIAVDGFKKPLEMRPFEKAGLGELWLASMNRVSIVPLMWRAGIQRRSEVSRGELAAYATLLKREDGGKAFLKIMRSFEPTAEKQALYEGALRAATCPIQIVWGRNDPALTAKRYGAKARQILPDAAYFEVAGKHFFPEDNAAELARLLADFAAAAN